MDNNVDIALADTLALCHTVAMAGRAPRKPQPRATNQTYELDERPELGQFLLRLRTRRRWGQIETADRAGVSRAYVSQIETGARQTRVDPEKLAALLRVLCDTPAEFSKGMTLGGFPQQKMEQSPQKRFESVLLSDPFLSRTDKEQLLAQYLFLVGPVGRR